MFSIFFSILFIFAVVDAVRQTERLSEVRAIGMGIVSCLVGFAVLFIATIVVSFVATMAVFWLMDQASALKVTNNDWYLRGLSLGTTIVLYYPFSRAVQAWYRKAEAKVDMD